MTTMTATRPRPTTVPRAPSWLRELTDTRTMYEESFGLPVSMHVTARRVVLLVGNRVDAIAMPVALARRVQADLRIAMLTGPVIAGPGNQRWTFLTGRAAPVRNAVQDELSGSRVHLIPRGARVIVPAVVDATEGWHWAEMPQLRRSLPPWAAVVATIRRALDQIEVIPHPR